MRPARATSFAAWRPKCYSVAADEARTSMRKLASRSMSVVGDYAICKHPRACSPVGRRFS